MSNLVWRIEGTNWRVYRAKMGQSTSREILNSKHFMFDKYLRAGEKSAMLTMYVPDCKLYGGTQLVDGTEISEKFWERFLEKEIGSCEFEIVSIDEFGTNRIIDESVYTIYDKEGTAFASGKFIIMWKKLGDGEWRIIYEFWNAAYRKKSEDD